MTGNDTTRMIWLVVVLVAAISALVARRMPVGTMVRSAIAWTAIVLVIIFAVSRRHEITAAVTRVDQGLGISDQQVSGSTVRIRMASDGHFWAQVNLNGVERTMLIDSGATNTTISEATARAAGIERDRPSVPVEVETANGSALAWPAHAKSVAVGSLSMANLGVDIADRADSPEMLGMNFLSRLGSWRVEGRTLILEPDRGAARSASKPD